MAEVGAHKQIVNRLLEPFTHIRTLVTATDFDNFFGLRLDSGADPTMQALANEMWTALAKSRPVPLKFGQWHLPYVNQKDKAFLAEINNFIDDTDGDLEPIEYLKRISAARCARLSYKSNETGRTATVAEDLALYNRLMGAQPLHASPTEHQATPDVAATAHWVDEDGQTEDKIHWYHPHQHGNFRGWIQFRKQIPGEACAPLPEQFLPF
jgi:hypothetical protein